MEVLLVLLLHIFELFLIASGRSPPLDYQCVRPGMNQHPIECHVFIICVQSQTGKLTPAAVFNCPPGQAFSDEQTACVDSNLVHNCPIDENESNEFDTKLRKYPKNHSSSEEYIYCQEPGVICDPATNSIVICSIIEGKLMEFASVECYILYDAHPICCDGDFTCTDRTCGKSNSSITSIISIDDNGNNSAGRQTPVRRTTTVRPTRRTTRRTTTTTAVPTTRMTTTTTAVPTTRMTTTTTAVPTTWTTTTTTAVSTTITTTTTTAVPTTITTTTSTTTTTTRSSTTTRSTITTLPQCRFQSSPIANPASTDCTTYYQCYIDSNYKLYPVLTHCPPNQAFSVLHGYCMDATYVVCNSPFTTTTTTAVPVICKKDGTSIPDPASTDCRTYYKCNFVNGVFIPVLNTCPPYMIFSPTYGRCINEAYYTCPSR